MNDELSDAIRRMDVDRVKRSLSNANDSHMILAFELFYTAMTPESIQTINTIINTLADAGISWNAFYNGKTPLLIAIKNNDPDAVDVILSKNVNILSPIDIRSLLNTPDYSFVSPTIRNRIQKANKEIYAVQRNVKPDAKIPFHIFDKQTPYTTLPKTTYKAQGFRGPICDTLGFHQHSGECWSDTMQQLLFFSDGLKETTQELIYTLSQDKINALFDAYMYTIYPNYSTNLRMSQRSDN